MSDRLGSSSAVLAAAAALATLGVAVPAQDAQPASPTAFDPTIRPLIATYCLECHSTDAQEGDLDLERFRSHALAARDPDVWQAVADQLADGAMPPEDAQRQLAAEDRTVLLHWARALLADLAAADAGDPGPVVLRRLSNAEYTYTLRDLTGVAELDPAREFPVDGAAGEGFMNVGNALVMSPALFTKYLDAAKAIAAHVVLVPDGIRFSPRTTRSDWTFELLGEIRARYRQYSDPRRLDAVDPPGALSGIDERPRIPLERYLAATLELRDSLPTTTEIEARARARGLSPRYLGALLAALQSPQPSVVLAPICAKWRRCAPADVPALAAEIAAWQDLLWKFNPVGHIGKVGGPPSWLEAVDPITTRQELRVAMPNAGATDSVTIRLVATAFGSPDADAAILWGAPRFVGGGGPDLLLRDVRAVAERRIARRARLFACAGPALAAANDAFDRDALDVDELARRHAIDPPDLQAWLACVGIVAHPVVTPAACFATPLERASQHDFVTGWGDPATPIVVANSSDQFVRIPGDLRPHSIAVHPSPTSRVAVGWRSPVDTTVDVAARVQHAHTACGNGVVWSLELRRGATLRTLAQGTSVRGALAAPPRIEQLAVRTGDMIAVRVRAGDHDHSCDLTAVDLEVTDAGEGGLRWDLAADCAPNLTVANPHADQHGNADVWYFFAEPDVDAPGGAVDAAAGSLLDRWRTARDPGTRARLADELQLLLTTGRSPIDTTPDGALYRALASLGGPLATPDSSEPVTPAGVAAERPGLDPARFGADLDGRPIDAANLCTRVRAEVEVTVPIELVEGREFLVSAELVGSPAASVALQPQVVVDGPSAPTFGVHPAPFVATDASEARARLVIAFDAFRALFPAALCYARIVPVDEVVTLTQFHREDGPLVRLMLDEPAATRLDRLWDELHFVSRDALTQVDVFEQLWQYATQDSDPSLFEPLREPIARRAAAFRERLLATEPIHVAAVTDFAGRAYRRPLTDDERTGLADLYRSLRDEGLAHDAAIRLLVARVLVAPSFLYRAEQPPAGSAAGDVSSHELACRLSYFLWSSAPDAALLDSAASGALHDPDERLAQTRRMLRDPKVRRLAVEFGCAWLHVYAFDEVAEKSERHFPMFAALRGAMYEETVRFLTHLLQDGGTVLDLLDADHTFLDAQLAAHYGIPGAFGDDWQRVDGIRRFGRGGVLAQATILATQSGASRTSPILRGNWVSEVLLGERLPRPPKGVPPLPDGETSAALTMRELTERHTSDPRCARCHERIDAFGFSLEAFDAIGRRRDRDLAGRPIDTRVTVIDGAEFDGIDGLRSYLLTNRRDAFVHQFCKKLLGYALGRAVRLSDEPLLTTIAARLEEDGYRIDRAIEEIVLSEQFTTIRGRDASDR